MAKWVQPSESLPKGNQEEVLASLEKANGETLVTALVFQDGAFGDETYGEIPQRWVKAWMPLPEPFES